MSKTRTAQNLRTTHETVSKAAEEGLIHLIAEDSTANGRTVTLNGREYINFGSCSYLGLELDPRIKAGTIDAVERYGSQFASSRAYLSVKLYEEAEELLGRIFQRPLILATSLTLGHMSTLPVLVGDDDVVILDHQVHASVHMAVAQLRNRGIKVEMIRHSNMNMLESRIQKLKDRYNKIWYLADGIYSMYGDYAPIEDLKQLLDKYEQLRLYIDDAHGSGCIGKNGCGFVHTQLPYHPRMFLTCSLAKSFATAGGVLIFPDEESRQLVRTCGGTLIFSGPIQPPMLGGAIASLKIHLSDELEGLQSQLRNRIASFNYLSEKYQLPIFSESTSPVCFINVGTPNVGYNMVKRVMNEGFYLNLAVYPSVPYKNTGLRLAINNHLSFEDIENIIRVMADQLPLALNEENSDMEDVYKAFGMKLIG